MKRKTPSRCAGAFLRGDFAGSEGKGVACGGRGALAGRKTSPQRAGRFCVATFAGSGGKGHYLGGKSRPRSTRGILRDNIRRAGRQKALSAAVDTLSRTEKRLRSDAGAFCVTTFSGQNGKGRCPQRSGALAGGKRPPQQPYRSLRQKKTSPQQPHRSLRQKKTSLQQSHRSLRQKKRPHGSRTALSGRKNTPQRARTPFLPVRPSWAGRTQPAAPGLTSGGALVPLRPPPFPRPPQRAGPGASPPAARACTGRQRRRRPAGGRRTSGGCRNGFA